MESLDNLDKLRYSDGELSTAEIPNTMQDVMQEHAAVYRTSKTLSEGKGKIDEVVQSFENVKVTDKSLIWNTDMVETLELHNLLGYVATTMYSAEARNETRGAHAHENHPDREDEEWMKHTVRWRTLIRMRVRRKSSTGPIVTIRWMRMSARWWSQCRGSTTLV